MHYGTRKLIVNCLSYLNCNFFVILFCNLFLDLKKHLHVYFVTFCVYNLQYAANILGVFFPSDITFVPTWYIYRQRFQIFNSNVEQEKQLYVQHIITPKLDRWLRNSWKNILKWVIRKILRGLPKHSKKQNLFEFWIFLLRNWLLNEGERT